MNEILSVIFNHYRDLLPQIAQYTHTGYSFEEWLNWEAFWACHKKGWKSSPKPEYKAVGFKNSKYQADLLVDSLQIKKTLIEFGLVHDCTQSHWRDKLGTDRKKLEAPYADTFWPIQVVYVTSRYDFRKLENWTDWLNKISFWNQPAIFNQALTLPEGGVFLMKAWNV